MSETKWYLWRKLCIVNQNQNTISVNYKHKKRNKHKKIAYKIIGIK